MPKKKGKKKKNPEMEKLNKQTEILRKDTSFMDFFVTSFDLWFHNNNENLMGLLSMFDVNNSGTIDYFAFKSALFDLDAPCNKIESHLICRLIDSECAEKIEYDRLEKGLVNILYNEPGSTNPNERIPVLTDKQPVPKRINSEDEISRLVQWRDKQYTEKAPEYIEITLRLMPFEQNADYPCHVTSVVNTNITGLGLASLIRTHTNASINLPNIQIYANSECDDSSMLPLGTSLQQKHFAGGTRNHPEQLLMFYTFITEHTKCPLLLCDHYMTVQNKSASGNKEISVEGQFFASRRR